MICEPGVDRSSDKQKNGVIKISAISATVQSNSTLSAKEGTLSSWPKWITTQVIQKEKGETALHKHLEEHKNLLKMVVVEWLFKNIWGPEIRYHNMT